MTPECPRCGSRDLRYGHLRSPSEKIARLAGVRPLRCRDCRHRFVSRTWKLSDLSHARCPKCLGAELTFWSPSHYHVTFLRGVLLFFGAHPYRCERCRCNFVSFRKRRHKQVAHRPHGAQPTPSPAAGSEAAGRQTDPHKA